MIQLKRTVLSVDEPSASNQAITHEKHIIPGNQALPPHEGMLITRGLTELACLLPQQLSFKTATRLLGWQTQETAILAETTLRNLVLKQGQAIREAEVNEARNILCHLRQPQTQFSSID